MTPAQTVVNNPQAELVKASPVPVSPCNCVFYSDRCQTCDFDFMKKFISKERVPAGCSRGITRRGKHTRFFEIAILGELERNIKMGFSEIHEKFPYLKDAELTKILNRLRRAGKIVRLVSVGNRNGGIWRVGNPLWNWRHNKCVNSHRLKLGEIP